MSMKLYGECANGKVYVEYTPPRFFTIYVEVDGVLEEVDTYVGRYFEKRAARILKDLEKGKKPAKRWKIVE